MGSGGVNVQYDLSAGGGPLDFDYLLKAGVTTEANALAIAAMAGIPMKGINGDEGLVLRNLS
jgi:DNA mismatch repair ATPase MutS